MSTLAQTMALRPTLSARSAPRKPATSSRAALVSRPAPVRKSATSQRATPRYRLLVAAAAGAEADEVALDVSAVDESKQDPKQSGITVDISSIQVGQMLKGTVKSTTAYGAFVDVGMGKDGLVHISQLSDSFVSDVKAIVKPGQQVEVRVLDVDFAKGRLGLSMKSGAPESAKSEANVPARGQIRQARASGGRGRSDKSKSPVDLPFSIGDKITGKVTRTLAFGAFVEVADGVEGLLHQSEIMIPEGKKADSRVDELVTVGEAVEVSVLDIKSGKISLSNKTAEYRAEEEKLMGQGVGVAVRDATTALEYALRKAGVKATMFSGAAAEEAAEAAAVVDGTPVEHALEPVPEYVAEVAVPEGVTGPVLEDPAPEPTVVPEHMKEPSAAVASGNVSAKLVKELRDQSGAGMMDCKKALAECGGDLQAAAEFLRKKGIAKASKKAGRTAADGMIGSYIHAGDRLGVLVEINCETDFVARGEIFRTLAADIAMQIAACPDVKVVSTEDIDEAVMAKEKEIEMGKDDILSKPEQIREKIVSGRLKKTAEAMALLNQPYIKDSDKNIDQLVKETIAATGENIKIRRFQRFQLGEGIEKKQDNFAAEVASMGQALEPKTGGQSSAPEAPKETVKEEAPKVEVSAKLVKQLRDQSGAGMMDCKKALAECGGDVEAAQEFLRKKGIAKADKKAGRVAAEGVICSYIHAGARLGVLMEINCETDFVARGEKFQNLAQSMAMQIAACPDVTVVKTEDVDPEFLAKERAIEMEKEDIQSKPENIREKIVDGRIAKIAKEKALYEQSYVKDPSKTVAEVIKEAIATIGENIQVRRFERYVLGEGIEIAKNDFASEVAAITGAK